MDKFKELQEKVDSLQEQHDDLVESQKRRTIKIAQISGELSALVGRINSICEQLKST